MRAGETSGRFVNRPYGFIDHDDAVNMVRHDHEGIQGDAGVMRRQGLPYPMQHPPGVVQVHAPIGEDAEPGRAPVRADGDEIGARLPVIVFGQAN